MYCSTATAKCWIQRKYTPKNKSIEASKVPQKHTTPKQSKHQTPQAIKNPKHTICRLTSLQLRHACLGVCYHLPLSTLTPVTKPKTQFGVLRGLPHHVTHLLPASWTTSICFRDFRDYFQLLPGLPGLLPTASGTSGTSSPALPNQWRRQCALQVSVEGVSRSTL